MDKRDIILDPGCIKFYGKYDHYREIVLFRDHDTIKDIHPDLIKIQVANYFEAPVEMVSWYNSQVLRITNYHYLER